MNYVLSLVIAGLLTPTVVIAEPQVTAPIAVTAPLENCYLYVLSKVPLLPRTKDIRPNTTPTKGAVVLFEYPQADGTVLPHYAVYMTDEGEGFWVDENNFEKGVTAPRWVRWNDPSLRGFFDPTSE